jgi:hypothetical protein
MWNKILADNDSRRKHAMSQPVVAALAPLQDGEYVSRGPEAEGWLRSERLGALVRLSRCKTPISTWSYRLEHREG